MKVCASLSPLLGRILIAGREYISQSQPEQVAADGRRSCQGLRGCHQMGVAASADWWSGCRMVGSLLVVRALRWAFPSES